MIYFVKTNTKRFFWSTKASINIISLKLPLISWPSPNIEKIFFRLSLRDDELLSPPKIATFQAKLLPKFYESATSNAILKPLHSHPSLSLFFAILVAPNNHFKSLTLLMTFLAHVSHRWCAHLEYWLYKYFVLQPKGPCQILFPSYIKNVLCYAREYYAMV